MPKKTESAKADCVCFFSMFLVLRKSTVFFLFNSAKVSVAKA